MGFSGEEVGPTQSFIYCVLFPTQCAPLLWCYANFLTYYKEEYYLQTTKMIFVTLWFKAKKCVLLSLTFIGVKSSYKLHIYILVVKEVFRQHFWNHLFMHSSLTSSYIAAMMLEHFAHNIIGFLWVINIALTPVLMASLKLYAERFHCRAAK